MITERVVHNLRWNALHSSSYVYKNNYFFLHFVLCECVWHACMWTSEGLLGWFSPHGDTRLGFGLSSSLSFALDDLMNPVLLGLSQEDHILHGGWVGARGSPRYGCAAVLTAHCMIRGLGMKMGSWFQNGTYLCASLRSQEH